MSTAVYEEIAAKLNEAGYSHAFTEEDGRELIDMAGIAIMEGP